MTRQEQVDEMAKYICNACEMGHGFDGCSYGGREHYKRCSITQKTAKALYNAGYRNISEYEAEIKRLEEKCEELLNEKWDAQDDLDCYYDEMPSRINQAVQDFAEKVKAKSYVNNYCREVVEVEKIDELLKEYEK